MIEIPLTKMVAAGNDFVVVDARRRRLRRVAAHWPEVARALCDRRDGVGADGLLVLEPSRTTECTMRVFNPDGSEAAMCGNGARCVAVYLDAARHRPRKGPRRSVTIETNAGRLSAQVSGGRVAMRMADPTSLRPDMSLEVSHRRLRLGFANTGVPHAVVSVKAVDGLDVISLGRALRHHRRFGPQGANVNFVQVVAGRSPRLRVRTYERGVEGETPACGTGATASALLHALHQARGRNGPARRFRVGVETQSRERLTVSCTVIPDARRMRVTNVVLEGSARRVFDGTVQWPHHLPRRRGRLFGRKAEVAALRQRGRWWGDRLRRG